MPTTTDELKSNTQAIRENLAALKELNNGQVKANLDKNRQELRSFKSEVDGLFKGLSKSAGQGFDFRDVLQKSLNDTAKQLQKTLQQSLTQAFQQSFNGGGGGMGGLFGNLLQAPLSGLFRNSQGQSMADATKALMRGRRNN